MPVISVAVPGPWWTLLSYASETEPPKGVRVRGPLGPSAKAGRVGIVRGLGGASDGITLKPITEIIDELPPLPPEMLKTIEWFGHNWFLGCGMSMKTLLPAKFLAGEPLEPRHFPAAETEKMNVRYSFEPVDRKRLSGYAEILEADCSGAMVLFPEVASAKYFWETLPAQLREKGLLWPETGPAKQWQAWQEIRLGAASFVVGAPGASFLPLPRINRIIVDNEDSSAWCTQKHPDFHRRSLLAARARYAGAELILGGRMPSAKVAMQNRNDPRAKRGIEKRVIYVSLHDSKGYESINIKDKLPISSPLARETGKALADGRFALWILDRKGYAGEIYCDDCGAAIYCSECGRAARWEEKKNRLYCPVCKKSADIPETCPSCGSGFLAGQRPGIEAVAERAGILFRSRGPVLWLEDKIDAQALKTEYPKGALIVGTRKIIALADELDVAMAGWIDADGEARSSEYDSKARAFGLIWESAWRGIDPENRTVVIQSRRPDRGWQGDLKAGWGSFWEKELKERKILGLPPFSPMLKIEMPRGKGKELARQLEEADFDFWESGEDTNELWVRTRHFDALRSLLSGHFDIRRTRFGMPAVTLYLN